jgi:hypothetical protein
MSFRNVVRVQIETPQASQIALPDINLLPKAPGNNWGDTAFKGNHMKRQVLSSEWKGNFGKDYKPTYVREGATQPELTQSCTKLYKCLTGQTPMQSVQRIPSEVVLGFEAYYKEGVVESVQENERLHKMLINYYVVDDTVYIVEKSNNSGMPVGSMLKRQRVNRVDGSGHLTAQDFNISESVQIHGRVYRIVNCDAQTRSYLTEQLGMYVPEPEPYPEDQYRSYRSTKVQPTKAPRSYDDKDLRLTLEQQAKGRVITHYPGDIQRVQRYLQDSDKVLRFYASWDDRDQPHGDIRTFELRYYIQDDTIVVAERLPPNAGRDGGKVFCSRRRCPKPNFQCKANDLTFSHRVNGIVSEYHAEADEKVFYGLRDLQIGGMINVFGRDLMLYDADTYTRTYYAQNLGELGPALENPTAKTTKEFRTTLPPYNGFGSEEDSAASCGSLLLKGPKKDTTKWNAMDGKVLRFKLKMYQPDIAEDNMREFVMSFHLADDTIAINECAVPNTGFLGGKVLRQKVKKYEGEGSQVYYGPGDFRVGEVLLINSMSFIVESMDKYTEDYYNLDGSLGRKLEISPQKIKALLNRLRGIVDTKYTTVTEAFRKWDTDHDGYVTLGELSEVIANMNMNCLDEELVAIMAQFDPNANGRFSFQQFMAIMNGDLVNPPLAPPQAPEDVPKFIQKCKMQTEAKDVAKLRLQTLKLLKEKLTERRLNGFEMFRMISTVPGGPQGPASSYITPTQVRIALVDILDMKLNRDQEECIVSYFFPNIPAGAGDRDVIGDKRLRVDLATFHKHLIDLGNMGLLPRPK